MYIKSAILAAAAALSAGVAADFLVITEYPQALETLSPEQQQSWLADKFPSVQSEFLEVATDASYLAAAVTVAPQLRDFVATASHSIPPVVTALDDFEIYTTVPAWYSDLPSGVRSFYDDAAKRVESILDESFESAGPSGNEAPAASSPAPPASTGRAGKVEVGLGASVAAGLIGVLML